MSTPVLTDLSAALAGQYTIERELGRGGMGIVLLARDERLDRQVALKVLPPALAEQAETRERFLREARMAARLSHPNIVPVYRADEIGGYAFFAMGFIDGETLAERVQHRGSLPAAEVARIMREVAWALAYAHAREIVHRDVKPENILIERGTGRAIVTDFGIARADYNPSLTQDGLVLGTVHYMSPEQASGDAVDGRSDLYALGCVGFFALSGTPPFDGAVPHAVLVAHATRQPPRMRDVTPAVPLGVAAVIDRCLHKRPDDRFATGEELADALDKALETMQGDARSDGGAGVISNEAAMAVWRRAAELQVEAASRLESRVRSGADEPGRAESRVPTDAYRVRDVEAAAAEVGISQRYVALALAELQSSPSALQNAVSPPAWKDRLATRLLGTSQRALSVSRIIRFPPRIVLQALGRAFQAPPYLLSLRDTIGGHPLDGGVLVFDLPGMPADGGNYKWSWTKYGAFVPELQATLANVPGDPRACEVTLHLDLRRGLTANLVGYGVLSGIASGLGAVGAGVFAVQALALAGAAVVGPAVAGAAVLGIAGAACFGPMYRWELRKATAELEAALASVETAIRALDIFGETTNR